MKRCALRSWLILLLALSSGLWAGDAGRRELVYAPDPVDNPLKGLVPYANPDVDRFPHSLEFDYLPLSALVTREKTYDWSKLEKLLNGIAGRGHQAVFRIYLEYPGKTKSIPAYLIEDGLKVHHYANPEAPKEVSDTPDYANPALRACLKNFIAALGSKYDGDARIGFITAGLLGHWGEWHTYPREDLSAGKDVQIEVMDAYEAAFKRTPVLLRYPADSSEADKAPNAARPFGYHDDSFAWATLETRKRDDDWFFMAAMKRAGTKALDKWKTQPIGGEIRPEAWGTVFDEKPGNKKIQDFETCVKETHATWLMDSGLFEKKTWNAERQSRAEEQVRKMGYAFHVPAVTLALNEAALEVRVEIVNRGVAPFYYDWSVEFALLDEKKAATTFAGKGSLKGLLPGAPARVWAESFDVAKVAAGTYTVGMRVLNPLPKGKALRFANKEQGEVWLKLGTVSKK